MATFHSPYPKEKMIHDIPFYILKHDKWIYNGDFDFGSQFNPAKAYSNYNKIYSTEV